MANANASAQVAKEKGNEAFKSSDYAKAVGHYSEAILADRTDPTLPLNRAAAYLKLGKNEDAERDCNTVLRLSPSNVKALFRRGQAKLALGKLLEAREDFNSACRLETNNTSIQDELRKVDQLIAVEKSKKAKVESARASFAASNNTPSISPPKRRRVPIKVIEPGDQRETPGTQAADVKPLGTAPTSGSPILATPITPDVKADTIIPVSTRSLKTPPSTPHIPSQPTPQPQPAAATATPPGPSSPATFAEAKQARESARQSRVGGGGIFRANGHNTIFSPKDLTPPVPVPPKPAQSTEVRDSSVLYPAKISTITGPVSPMTMFNFSKAWEANQSAEERWKLIISIPPASIPSMCKSSLEPALFISIIDVFIEVVKANAGDQVTVDIIKAYLGGFEGVPRFSTVLLFLSEKEKTRVRELWKLLGMEMSSGTCWSLG